MRSVQSKVIDMEVIPELRRQLRKAGKKLVATNGCFDLLHIGHVSYLQSARELGDILIIGVNDDSSVKLLKGNNRPVNNQINRGLVLAALECVDYVCVFPGKTAISFLSLVAPDVYVKGGDYTVESLNQEERQIVESAGGKIIFGEFLEGVSTTQMIDLIQNKK